ncbi:hypothetical protein ACFVUS_25095 [Nocardia sp. NPDC058058]|uniref:hypothetical protein n=1 Tax=Nocardia sp. NPDC058058 TaxID=3346317 RepID=UPI0036D95F8B
MAGSDTSGFNRRRSNGARPGALVPVPSGPLDARTERALVTELLTLLPATPTPELARIANMPEAAINDLRISLLLNDDSKPTRIARYRRRALRVARMSEPAGSPPTTMSPSPMLRELRRNSTLRDTESGRRLLRRLDLPNFQDPHWERILGELSPHRMAMLASLARDCADRWRALAETLETGTRNQYGKLSETRSLAESPDPDRA